MKLFSALPNSVQSRRSWPVGALFVVVMVMLIVAVTTETAPSICNVACDALRGSSSTTKNHNHRNKIINVTIMTTCIVRRRIPWQFCTIYIYTHLFLFTPHFSVLWQCITVNKVISFYLKRDGKRHTNTHTLL